MQTREEGIGEDVTVDVLQVLATNDNGDIAGNFIDSSGIARGFNLNSDGTFSDPIVDRKDDVGLPLCRDTVSSG